MRVLEMARKEASFLFGEGCCRGSLRKEAADGNQRSKEVLTLRDMGGRKKGDQAGHEAHPHGDGIWGH